MRRLAPVFVAVALAACGSPSKPSAAARNAAVPTAPPREDPACAAARARLATFEMPLDTMKDGQATCAALGIRHLADTCAALTLDARKLADRFEERDRTRWPSAPELSSDGRWVLQSSNGVARIFDRSLGGAGLAYRLVTKATWTLGPNDLAFGLEDGALHVLDLKTGAVHAFDDVEDVETGAHHLALIGNHSAKLVDLQSFSIVDTVPLDHAIAGSFPRFYEDARVIGYGDAFACFKPHLVKTSAHVVGASRDQRRVVVCDNLTPFELRVIDTATGKAVAHFSTKDTEICEFSTPAITPDGSRIVGAGWANGRDHLVAKVFDIATGKVLSVPDRAHVLGTALDSTVSFADDDDKRLCVSYGNLHWRKQTCGWLIDDKGNVTLSPEPAPRVHPSGVELARGVSDDGTTIAIAMADARSTTPPDIHNLAGPFDGKDLRVVFFEAASTRLLATVPVLQGDFQVPVPAVPSVSMDWLIVLSATRAYFEPNALTANGLGPLPHALVVDAASGSTRPLENAEYVGHGVAVVGHELVDLKSDRRVSLDVSEEAWNAAPITDSDCGS